MWECSRECASLEQIGSLQKKSKIKKPRMLFCVRENIRENEKQRFALHLVTAWRAAFEFRDTIPFGDEGGSIFSPSFSLFLFFLSPDGGTRASLMDLARGTAFDASVRIVSFMTLIMPCMREPRYIMYLIICWAKYIIQNSGGYEGTAHLSLCSLLHLGIYHRATNAFLSLPNKQRILHINVLD